MVGKRAAKTVARRVPIAGGFYGAGADGYSTWSRPLRNAEARARGR